MNCEACKPLLGEYIDGELPDAEREAVERHVRRCNACRRQVEFLERLSHDAASLPKDLQPGKDLWPAIEDEIAKLSHFKSSQPANESLDIEYKSERRRKGAWWFIIAAAMMIGLLAIAGTYLLSTKPPAGVPHAKETSNARREQAPSDAGQALSRSSMNRQSAAGSREPGRVDGRVVREFTSEPLDPFDKVFISNYGIYLVRQDFDPSSLSVKLNYVLGFDQNGMRPWIPPLPSKSLLLSVYPGEGNRLWASYEIQEPRFQSVIAELDFGVDSKIRNIWKSYDLHIGRFLMGSNGSIYASGFSDVFKEDLSGLPDDQSITTDILHIIDARTGVKRNLLTVTLYPEIGSRLRLGQTSQNINDLASNTTIAVKSNGNFFVTADLTSTLPSVRGVIKNEAIEYFPNGMVARKWDLDRLEPDEYLNNIFVDVDDSILAEIIRYPDMDSHQSLDRTMIKRYLLRVDLSGRTTPYRLDFYPNESIQGWIGKTQELVTVISEEGIKQISIHKLSF